MTRQYRLQRRLPLEPLLALFDPVDRTLNAGPGPEFEARTGMSRRQLFR